MVLKINDNLITPSHIIEGDKVNDTYFEGKYHLMLPNSEERFLTSVSERKQLLNESLRSNLYDRKTKGTISANATSGKMFEESIEETFYTPILTENGTLGGDKHATTASHQSQPAFWAFNGEENKGDDCWWTAHGRATESNPCWITFYYPSPVDIIGMWIKNEIVTPENVCNANIQVSNDNQTWKTVYTIINRPNESGYEELYKFNAGGKYQYIRLYVTYGYSSGGISIQQIKIRSKQKSTTDNAKYRDGDGVRTVTQKPFNQNVTINSSEIQEGTKYLVDYPGMFQIKTEDNTLAVKFLFEDKPAWKYIKQEELVEGDNVLSLVSDTERLKFIVNSTEHVLVDTLQSYKSAIVDFPTNTYLLEHIANGSFIIENRVLKNNSSVTKDNCQLNSSCSFETGDKQSTLTVSGTISSESGCDYGALYVGTAEYKMTKNNMKNAQTDGNGEYAIVGAGSVSVENKEITLQPNTKYYINIAYAKDGSGRSGTDNIQITKFVLSDPINIVILGKEIPELTAGYLGYREGWKQV